MIKLKYPEIRSCPQRNSTEHKRYVGAQSVDCQEVGKQDGAELLQWMLNRDNLNRPTNG